MVEPVDESDIEYLRADKDDLEYLLRVIADENANELLRRDLMHHLAGFHDSRAFELLARLGKHTDPMMRGDAVLALSRSGDDRAFDVVIDALHDEDDYVRYVAILALNNSGDLRALPALVDTAQNDNGICYDDGSSLRSAAVRAIQRIQGHHPLTPNP
jgi:HEAT repeat protein